MPSASCCFLLVFYIAGNQYQTESKRSKTFCGFFMDQKTPVGTKKYQRGAPWEEQPTRACLGAQAHLGGLCPPRVPPRTITLLYKYPNIPETLGESTKINSSSRRVQNHQIQSRHHHGGVHHFHCDSPMMRE